MEEEIKTLPEGIEEVIPAKVQPEVIIEPLQAPLKFVAEYEFALVEVPKGTMKYFETSRVKDELADWLVKNGYPDTGDFYKNFRCLRDVLGFKHVMTQLRHKSKDNIQTYTAEIKENLKVEKETD